MKETRNLAIENSKTYPHQSVNRDHIQIIYVKFFPWSFIRAYIP